MNSQCVLPASAHVLAPPFSTKYGEIIFFGIYLTYSGIITVTLDTKVLQIGLDYNTSSCDDYSGILSQ